MAGSGVSMRASPLGVSGLREHYRNGWWLHGGGSVRGAPALPRVGWLRGAGRQWRTSSSAPCADPFNGHAPRAQARRPAHAQLVRREPAPHARLAASRRNSTCTPALDRGAGASGHVDDAGTAGRAVAQRRRRAGAAVVPNPPAVGDAWTPPPGNGRGAIGGSATASPGARSGWAPRHHRSAVASAAGAVNARGPLRPR